MKFRIQTGLIEKQQADCFVVGVFAQQELTPAAKKLDKLSRGYLTEFLKKTAFQGKLGHTSLLYQLPHCAAKWILLVGCGKNTTLSTHDYRKIVSASIKSVHSCLASSALSFLEELNVENHDTSWKIKQTVKLYADSAYHFDVYKTEKTPMSPLQAVNLYFAEKSNKACQAALTEAVAVMDGVNFTKNLANQPSNICTPAYIAKQAQQLAKLYAKVKTKVFEEAAIKKLGMGALLAVGKGSQQPPRFIVVEYKGTAKKQAPIALVGKGITFDTGGISLKPADSMIGMKYDMCGAATVLGTIKAAAELKLPLNIVGIIASAENMPSGSAYKPEDIITSLSGQTIEVLNTDAEGRLVLCDALCHCRRSAICGRLLSTTPNHIRAMRSAMRAIDAQAVLKAPVRPRLGHRNAAAPLGQRSLIGSRIEEGQLRHPRRNRSAQRHRLRQRD